MFKYFFLIQETNRQQQKMWEAKSNKTDDRIVSIFQLYVRPIVRGKQEAKVELVAKIQLIFVNDYTFLDELSWDFVNEWTSLRSSMDQYKSRHDFYPKEVLADKIYFNHSNLIILKELGIRLIAKPLGRLLQ